MTKWHKVEDLDVNRKHEVIVECRCKCRNRMKAIWDEFYVPDVNTKVRCFLGEDNNYYGLQDFGRYREIGASLPIDTSDAALLADRNIREITSPVALESIFETVH